MAEPKTVYGVSEITGLIRNTLEKGFSGVTVEGEISNYRPASSGHLYFSLKDADAVLSAVMFRSRAQRGVRRIHRLRSCATAEPSAGAAMASRYSARTLQ